MAQGIRKGLTGYFSISKQKGKNYTPDTGCKILEPTMLSRGRGCGDLDG
jgi:hypothetical protein